MEFSRPAYRSGQPFPSPGDLPSPGIEPALLRCRRILYQLSYGASTCIKGSVRNYWTSELLGIIVVPFFNSLCLVEDNCFTILDWLLLWQKRSPA